MKWFTCLFLICFGAISFSCFGQERTIKTEINGQLFDIFDDNSISSSLLKDSVRINLKYYVDGVDQSANKYIYTYEVTLKRGTKTLYQMNYKKGHLYVFFPFTARQMLQPGDVIVYKMSTFTIEESSGGVHTQMLPPNMRELKVAVK